MNFFIGLLVMMTIASTNVLAMNTEVSGKLGMTAGAFNVGVDYVNMGTDYGYGGYVFFQSSVDRRNSPIVNGVTALGGMLKLVLVEKNSIKAYVAPGFGFAIVKDASSNTLGNLSDETIIGASLKIGVQLIRTPGFSLGIEQMHFSNWLNDSVNNFAGPNEYYSVVGSWTY